MTAPNDGVNCKAWQESTQTGTNGEVSQTIFHTEEFRPLVNFDISSTSTTIGIIDTVNMEIHTSCESVGGYVKNLDLVGGTITTKFYVSVDGMNTKELKTDYYEIPSTPKNVLYDSMNGISGTTIRRTTVTGTAIDDALTSTVENYLADVKTVTSYDLKFKSLTTGTLVQSATGSLSNVYKVKVHNEILDPVTPQNKDIMISKVKFNTETFESAEAGSINLPEYKSTGNTNLVIKVYAVLPAWKSTEGVPSLTVTKEDTTGSKTIVYKSPFTISPTIIDNASEFVQATSLPVNTLSDANYLFKIESNQNVRGNVDNFVLTVIDPATEEPGTPGPQPTQCNPGYEKNADGQCVPIQKTGTTTTPTTPNPSSNMIKEFMSCALRGDMTCLSNEKFFGIYALAFLLVMAVIIISLATKKKQYNPVAGY